MQCAIDETNWCCDEANGEDCENKICKRLVKKDLSHESDATLETCLNLCHHNTECHYISYTESEKICSLYDHCPSSRSVATTLDIISVKKFHPGIFNNALFANFLNYIIVIKIVGKG